MKMLLAFSLILFFTVGAFAQVDTVTWQLIRYANGVASYKNAQKPEVRATRIEKEGLKKSKFDALGTQEFVREMEESKRKLLTFIGVKDWKVDQIQTSKEKSETVIKMHGSYIDSASEKTGFVEIHRYSADKTVQMLYIQPLSKKRSLDFKMAESFTKTDYNP